MRLTRLNRNFQKPLRIQRLNIKPFTSNAKPKAPIILSCFLFLQIGALSQDTTWTGLKGPAISASYPYYLNSSLSGIGQLGIDFDLSMPFIPLRFRAAYFFKLIQPSFSDELFVHTPSFGVEYNFRPYSKWHLIAIGRVNYSFWTQRRYRRKGLGGEVGLELTPTSGFGIFASIEYARAKSVTLDADNHRLTGIILKSGISYRL